MLPQDTAQRMSNHANNTNIYECYDFIIRNESKVCTDCSGLESF